jgi:hypothetical protein
MTVYAFTGAWWLHNVCRSSKQSDFGWVTKFSVNTPFHCYLHMLVSRITNNRRKETKKVIEETLWYQIISISTNDYRQRMGIRYLLHALRVIIRDQPSRSLPCARVADETSGNHSLSSLPSSSSSSSLLSSSSYSSAAVAVTVEVAAIAGWACNFSSI